jgi:hypothetical protein
MAALTVAATPPRAAPGCPETPRAKASPTAARRSAATTAALTEVLMAEPAKALPTAAL